MATSRLVVELAGEIADLPGSSVDEGWSSSRDRAVNAALRAVFAPDPVAGDRLQDGVVAGHQEYPGNPGSFPRTTCSTASGRGTRRLDGEMGVGFTALAERHLAKLFEDVAATSQTGSS